MKNSLLSILQKSVFLGIILICTGCGAKKNVNYLRKCVKAATDEEFAVFYGDSSVLDVYEMVEIIEDDLRSDKLLQGVDKEGYVKLVDDVRIGNDHIVKHEVMQKFSPISGIVVVDMVSVCPYKTVVENSNRLNSSIVNQFKLSSQLTATGYDFGLIKDFAESIDPEDFSHVEYRAPIMVMLLTHIQNKSRR